MADDRSYRIMKDIADFYKHAIDGIIITDYDDTSMRYIDVSIVGPDQSPHAGGTFEFRINLPNDFPYTAPKVVMTTPVWHPNIARTGKVCMNVLSDWFPGTAILEVAEAVSALLTTPNPNSPLNVEAAWMIDTQNDMYEATAKMWTSIFANGPERPQEYNNKLNQVVEVLSCSSEKALRELTEWSWDVKNVVRHSRRANYL